MGRLVFVTDGFIADCLYKDAEACLHCEGPEAELDEGNKDSAEHPASLPVAGNDDIHCSIR